VVIYIVIGIRNVAPYYGKHGHGDFASDKLLAAKNNAVIILTVSYQFFSPEASRMDLTKFFKHLIP